MRRFLTFFSSAAITATLLALVGASLVSSPAQAAASSSNIRALGMRSQINPLAGSGNLSYHGGTTMHTRSTTYSIFWVPSGKYISSTYKSLINRYFGDVGGSGLYNINTQYYDTTAHIANSSSLGGTWTDTSAYPSGSLSDAQIQSEVSKAKTANGWTGGSTHLFFVFTAKGENICDGSSCSFTSFCAYHSHFSTTLYAAMPYTGTNLSACGVSTSPNNDFDADSTINVTSHEHMEAVTDPNGTAWYDAVGYEIGDKCAWTFGSVTLDGGKANVDWNGHYYIVQREWDNKISGCALTGP